MSDFDSKNFVAALPRRPGVYRMYGSEGELLYVGKARSLKDRVGSYFSPGKIEPKTFALVQQIANIEVTVTNSDTEALLLEYNLIKQHRPRFNIVLRDDKSFPYVQLRKITTSRGSCSTAARVAKRGVTSARSPAPAR